MNDQKRKKKEDPIGGIVERERERDTKGKENEEKTEGRNNDSTENDGK